MSATREDWKKVGQEARNDQCGDLEALYTEIFGPLFRKGLDIGRQVTAKLKQKDVGVIGEEQQDEPWSTMLQAEGLDNGITAGFLTVCGICVIGESAPFADVKKAIELHYDTVVTVEHIDTHEQLVEDYPEYANIPDEQHWTLPAVMIHYAASSD